MGAGGTDLRRLLADDNMSAVAAFPDLDLALFENLLHLDIFQQGAIAFLVVLFDLRDQTELCSQLRKAFFLGGFGKALIHVCPFVVLAVGGCRQILGGGADAVQLLEPELGVLLFVVGGFLKDGCDLLKAILFCL